MSVQSLSGFSFAPTSPPAGMLSELALRTMAAPANVSSVLWNVSTVDERRALLDQAPPKIELADAAPHQAKFLSPQTPLTQIPQKTIDAARIPLTDPVPLPTSWSSFFKGASGKAAGAIGLLVTPTNEAYAAKYEFAPDLRAVQRTGETTIRFEKLIDGEWQRLPVRAELHNGVRVDLIALKAAYGKPLPAALDPAIKTTTDRKDPRLCQQIGSFVADPQYAAREKNQPNANRYQDFISGHPGQHFHVSNPAAKNGETNYDGCVDTPKGPILTEAKGRHPDIFGLNFFEGNEAIQKQGQAQQALGKLINVPVVWFAQTAKDQAVIQTLFEDAEPNRVTLPVINLPLP
jgi:hypothetical protein